MPLFLIGLAGAAIPILIHLLTRDRIRRVTFSTLRFFARGSRSVLRRKRLQEAILVAMRCLACALLAVAFARPFFGGERAAEGVVEAETACAVVADLSGSMARAGLPEALREEARSALDALADGRDAAALVTFTGTPLVRMPLTKRLGEIRSRISLLEPGHGGTDIAEA
ncbi:MAG: vWA domain-containing protein, partial [Planctomycetota bacterium]